jgi:hypothetical protein
MCSATPFGPKELAFRRLPAGDRFSHRREQLATDTPPNSNWSRRRCSLRANAPRLSAMTLIWQHQ